MIFAAIDFGKSGGIAIGDDSKEIPRCFPMPNLDSREGIERLSEIIVSDTEFAVGELVSAMPGQGVTSMFNFGRGVGRIEGALTAREIPLELIRPVEWTAAYGKRKEYESLLLWKKHLMEQAMAYIGRPVPSGQADAILIWRHVRLHGRPQRRIKL